MASIGDLYFALHADSGTLELDATKAAQSAGGKAGDSFSSSFSKIVKTAASAVIGAGIGMALKAITAGAVELDAATRKYAADTGATVAETKLAGEQISALFRTNVDSYGVIGDVLAKLRTDLHVTGVEAQGLAQQFLHYALATSQDPVAATDAFTTAVKAWKISADAIPALMDEIVRGHQLYGGSISENVDVLARLAPALQASNLGIDTATGLLNLFSAAGLDSSKVAVAFQTALKKVHSPEELDKLLLQIQSTPDAFDRAKLAIALFGTRAGAQLADALAPGTKSLSDYTVTAAASAGATDTAAAAIDQGFGSQVVLAFHKVQDSLSGFATEVGPVVTVLDALGNMGVNVLPMLGGALGALAPKLVPYLKALLPVFEEAGLAQGAAMAAAEVGAETTGVVAGQAAVATAAVLPAEAAGTVIGGAMGAAAAVAIPLLILGAVAAAASAAEPMLHDFAIQIHDAMFGQHGPFDDIGTWLDNQDWPIGPKNTPVVDLGPFKDIFGGSHKLPDAAGATGQASGDKFGQDFRIGVTSALAGALPEVLINFSDYANAAQRYSNMMLSSLDSIAAGFKTKWSELTAVATGAADAIFGAQIRASNLAANTSAINAERAIIDSKKSTAQQKLDAETRLLALQKEGLGIKIEMAGRGELSAAAYRQLIATLTTQAKSNNAEVANAAKLALAELNSLKLSIAGINNVSLSKITKALQDILKLQTATGKGSGGPIKLAGGGPYMAGQVTLTGEGGLPELDVRATNGYIINHQEALAIAAGKFGPGGGQGSGGQAAPLIGQQNIYGIQPDDVERQTLRAMRRNQLQLSLAGGRR